MPKPQKAPDTGSTPVWPEGVRTAFAAPCPAILAASTGVNTGVQSTKPEIKAAICELSHIFRRFCGIYFPFQETRAVLQDAVFTNEWSRV